jgi:aminoglycoside 6-adenylyltransferase
MRNEREVLSQLLDYARGNEMVRAVMMNGSRVNPNVSQDIFCDYDVVFVVTDPEHFKTDQSWIKNFGDLIIMQLNDWPGDLANGYAFLMLFSDRVRIDLGFDSVQQIDRLLDDSLTLVLLDKDQLFSPFPPPSDTGYFIQKPGQKEYDEAANEFWWCSTYIAKGIWRDELCYAKYMFDVIVRDSLNKMVAWYIGTRHAWRINPGGYGKWFKKLLPLDLWESLVKTYAGVDYDEIWESLFEAGRLFRTIGVEVASMLGYANPMEDDQRVTEYIKRVRSLPKDATSFDQPE